MPFCFMHFLKLGSNQGKGRPFLEELNHMSEQVLIIREEAGICYLTINREKALNALNGQVMNALHEYFSKTGLEALPEKGVVLTGAGEKSFVAGADIKEFLAVEDGKVMAQRGQDTFFAIERFPKPVIAAVNGFALGGGCELAMACHMRIAGDHAKFGQPEVKLGIIPGYGGTQRLIQYIGKSKAVELIMTGDMIDAEEAHRLGLVNHVVPAGQEVEKSVALLNKIAKRGPVAIQMVIEAVNAYFQYDADGFAREVEVFGKTTDTEDFKEGASAFIEKRPPSFKGK